VIGDAGGALILPLALLGDRLGLFTTLAGAATPVSARTLARRTGLAERYLPPRGWRRPPTSTSCMNCGRSGRFPFTARRPDMARKMIDCRKQPSESGCTLTIAGQEDEVLDAAVAHAIAKHGHDDTAELREMIRAGLEDAEPALT